METPEKCITPVLPVTSVFLSRFAPEEKVVEINRGDGFSLAGGCFLDTGDKKLLGTSASLLVTSALLVVTRSY